MLYGMYTLFLAEYGHLDEFQMNVVKIAGAGTVFFAEAPTGYLADRLGRKRSFFVACLLFTAAFLLYSRSQTFIGFISSEVLYGIGSAAASGSFKAWAIDRKTYLRQSDEANIREVETLEKLSENLSWIFGSIFGGYIGSISLQLPWVYAAIGMIFTATFVHFFMDDYQQKTDQPRQTHSIRDLFKILRQSPKLKRLMILHALVMFCLGYANMQWAPLFTELGNSAVHVGWIGSLIPIMILIGLALTKIKPLLWGVFPLLALCFLGLGTFSITPLVLTAFLIHQIVRGWYAPSLGAAFHTEISKKELQGHRATIDSIRSMLGQGSMSAGLLITGVIALSAGRQLTFAVLGSAMLAVWALVSIGGKTRV